MAVKRCVDCRKVTLSKKDLSVNGKECPYCELWLCASCSRTQLEIYSWNGCQNCCIEYRNLLAK